MFFQALEPVPPPPARPPPPLHPPQVGFSVCTAREEAGLGFLSPVSSFGSDPAFHVGAQSDPPPAPPLDASSSCPPQPSSPSSPNGADGNRTALLNSIQTFRKGKLKKTETADRSDPVI